MKSEKPYFVKNIEHNHRNFSEMSYCEFVQKQGLDCIPIIEIVNGYGIYAYEFRDGTSSFGALDMKTGLPAIYGRKSLKGIRRDIKKGIIQKIEKEHPGIYSIKSYYETGIRQLCQEELYDDRMKRFPLQGEQFVLDLGAGDNPDLRATHAIDLVKPSKQFQGLEYQTEYDFLSSKLELPYPENYFDRVVSYGGLTLNFESLKIYKEIFRILKIGGNLEFNHSSSKTQKWLKKAGFQDIRNDEFFDEIFNEKISVIIATKILS